MSAASGVHISLGRRDTDWRVPPTYFPELPEGGPEGFEVLWALILRQNLRDFLDSVPTASRRRHTEKLLDFAEIANRFHLPAIDTQNESMLDHDDL